MKSILNFSVSCWSRLLWISPLRTQLFAEGVWSSLDPSFGPTRTIGGSICIPLEKCYTMLYHALPCYTMLYSYIPNFQRSCCISFCWVNMMEQHVRIIRDTLCTFWQSSLAIEVCAFISSLLCMHCDIVFCGKPKTINHHQPSLLYSFYVINGLIIPCSNGRLDGTTMAPSELA